MNSKNVLEEGKVQIYTGEGKGKTTAALGLLFRASGYDLDARMLQFIKQRECSEHIAAKRAGITLRQAKNKNQQEGCAEILDLAKKWLKEGEVDVLILDETGHAMRRGYITREDIEELIALKPKKTELVFTGRNLDKKIGDLADLITEMKPIKHYYADGLKARKGIEY